MSSLRCLLALFLLPSLALATESDFLIKWQHDTKSPAVAVLIQNASDQHFYKSGNIKQNTVFGVGSITKTVISTIVLQLVSEKKLNLDDYLNKYVPEYSQWKTVTIKQLLNMTSGIYNYFEDPAYKNDLNQGFKKSWNTDSLIAVASKHSDYFKPGQGWHYSNTAYLILGKIIQKVTDKSLTENIYNRIIQPLHLSQTYFSETKYDAKIFKKLAPGFYNNYPLKPNFPSNIGAATGGMIMDLHDLQCFIKHLLQIKDLIPAKELTEMLQGVLIPKGNIKPEDTYYGLGIGITPINKNETMIWYTGVTPWQTAIYIYLPKENYFFTAAASFNRHGEKDYDLLFPLKPLVQYFLKKNFN